MNIEYILTRTWKISPEQALKYIDEISTLLESSPADSALWHARAVLFNKLDNFERAIEDISAAIRLTSDNSDLLKSRAYYFFRAKRHQEAVQDNTVLIERHPQDKTWRIARAHQYYRLKELDLALRDIWTAYCLGADSVSAFGGIERYKLRPELEGFVEQNPSLTYGLNVLSLLYLLHSDEVSKSVELLQKSLSIEVQFDAALLLFHLQLSLNQIDNAAAALEMAEPLNPKHMGVLIAKGYLNAYRGNRPAAIQYFTEAIETEPDKMKQKELEKIIAGIKKGKKEVKID